VRTLQDMLKKQVWKQAQEVRKLIYYNPPKSATNTPKKILNRKYTHHKPTQTQSPN
jgi:hypothetical protein